MGKTGHNAIILPVRFEGKHIHDLELSLRDLLSTNFDHARRGVDAMITMSAVSDSAPDGFAGTASAFEDIRAGGQQIKPFLDHDDEAGIVTEGGFIIHAEVAPELGAEDFMW